VIRVGGTGAGRFAAAPTTTAACLALLLAAPMAAQVAPGSAVGASAFLETVSLSDAEAVGIDQIDLFTFLFAGRTAVADRLRIGVSGGFARGVLTRPDGSEATLSGLTDTQVTLSWPFAREFLVVSLVGVLPTGKSEVDAFEAEVANVVAADLLPFRVSHWGAGGGFGANVGFARPLGPVGVALGVGYVLGREYNPIVDDDFAFRPGNALTVTGGIDAGVGRAGKLAVQFAVQTFSDDQLDGGNLYNAGDRFQLMGTYAFPVWSGSGLAYAGFVHRTAGDLGDASVGLPIAGTPSQDLVLLGGGVRLAMGTGVLVPDLSVRIFRRSDAVGQGSVSRLGLGYEMPLGTLTFVPAFRAKFGSLQMIEGDSSGLTGFDVGLTVRYGSPGR
jgi:hypothetical protein